MELDEYLGKYGAELVFSFNPNSYSRLVTLPFREVLKFFFITLFWGTVIFTIVFLVMSVTYISDIPEKLENVEEFNLEGNLITDETITLIKEPSVAIAPPETDPEHFITITKKGMWYPEWLLFGRQFVSWDDVKDIKQDSPERNEVLRGFLVFLLPSVIFWFVLIGLAKLAILFLVMLLVGYFLPQFMKQKVLFKQNLKAACFAMPSAIIIGMGLSPLGFELFWWGAALSIIIFGLAIALLSERKVRRTRAKHK